VNADGVDVDTGFMVYNDINYPYLINFFNELGIKGEKTNMGFSVSMDSGALEWCGDTLFGLISTLRNIVNPSFYMMILDVFRFNKEAKLFLSLPDSHPDKQLTMGQFLSKRKFSKAFSKYYLVPMTAAIWSATTQGIMAFPALTLIQFLDK